MKPFFAIFSILLGASLPFSFAQTQDPKSPDDQFRALLSEYNKASSAFRKAATDEERNQSVSGLAVFAPKFIDLSEQFPKDAVALKTLRQAIQAVISTDSLAIHTWEMNRESFPSSTGQGKWAGKIAAVLMRDHIESEKLGPICDRMRYGIRPEFEIFLRAAREKNSTREVQGMATLASAQLWNNQVRMIDLTLDRPDLISRYDTLYGDGYFSKINGSGRSDLEKEIEKMLERATEFDDVTNKPFTETVAEKAKAELFELRHLKVGKTAPDIAGKDQDGLSLKLSEFRGKVVLLYFWMEY